MVDKEIGSRSEAEDITSAVLEGADAFILSHETSIGKYPIEAVIQLAKAIAEGENIIDYEQVYNDIRQDSIDNAKKSTAVDILATTACSIALDNNVDIFVCLTETGKIARFIAKYKPFQSILACTTSSAVVKQVNMTRGVIGYKIPSHLCKYLLSLLLFIFREIQ